MKNKLSIAITMLITLLLTSSTFVTIAFSYFPPAGTEIPTYSKINVGPNPVGVNQQVTINIFNAIPTLDRGSYEDMTVTVTDPQGHETELGPFDSDTTGGTYTTYTPDQVGTWKFQMFYPGQVLQPSGVIQMPGQSEVFELTVQEEQVTRESFPIPPGPQRYWETPVSAMNAENWYWHMGEWWGLSGITFEQTGANYYGGNYQPWSQAVNTGHVLWTKPWGAGGVAGGEAGPDQIAGHYWTTRQYQPQYAPIIMQGVMYATLWTTAHARSGNAANNGIVATNLFTGETLWTINTTERLQVGWEPVEHNINEYGVRGPYLITTGDHPGVNTTGTTFNIYDAYTGKYMASIINGSSMLLQIEEDSGEERNLKGYYLEEVEVNSVTQRYLVRWDIKKATGFEPDDRHWGIPPGEHEFTDGIEMREPFFDLASIEGVTDILPLEEAYFGNPIRLNEITNDACVFTGGFTFGQGYGGTVNGWLCVMAMDKNTGAQLWARNITYAETDTLLPFTRTEMGIIDGLWINANMENFNCVAYNARTGVKEWEIPLRGDNGANPHWYDLFNLRWSPGPGVSFFRGFGGDIWCIDNAHGTVRWYTNTTKLVGPPGAENPYGIWPLWVFECDCITNTIAYFPIGHEYNPPMFPGAQICAVNITDGSLVWSQLGMYIRSTSCAYDIVLSLNAYDNQIYAWGKGPSAVTVSAPDYGVTLGTPVTIKGTVMDISTGSKQSEVASNFPNGLPCISDEDMSHFMEYVYQEQILDYEVSGVEVVISTVDPNNNMYELGRTTSSSSGVFGLTVEPPVPGLYKIIATFDGTESYWGACAETYMYVGEAPSSGTPIEPEPPTEQPTEPEPEAPFITTEVAIIVAVAVIAVVAVAAYWLLRRRK